MNNMTKKSILGFSLLGVLLATGIGLIVIGVIASLASRIYQTTRTSKEAFIATALAREGVELVRANRDSNWFHYPEAGQEIPVTSMKWRGCADEATCPNLKSICNGDTQMISYNDASLKPATDGQLYEESVGGNIWYTHINSGPPSIFKRIVSVQSITASGDPNLTSGITYKDDILDGCGEDADSDNSVSLQSRPRPFRVISTVKWADPVTHVERSTSVQEVLFDWVTQRPR
jgi:type II secretory pathway pseudopilin PulG